MAACVPQPSQAALEKVGVEKSRCQILPRRLHRKVIRNDVSELAVGFENFRWRAEMRPAPRAQGPPRLAAGAGDRNAETLKDFHILGSSAQFPRAFFFGPDQIFPRVPIEMQAVPQVLF